MHAIIRNVPCLKQCVDFLKWGNFVHGAFLYMGHFAMGHFAMGHFSMGHFEMGHFEMGHLSFGAFCHVIEKTACFFSAIEVNSVCFFTRLTGPLLGARIVQPLLALQG